eukprot:CAMPEP_0180264318 /NCGR_PEP_ID=MMETSP0987-20121128/45751_1 /TAXON_ID=697907 /ORGANISM="non described non described, Strain CCMP2293" /LENGTH=533 /DNA_ID=CAMNT_0022234607 /DNA_START=382 /DNA_END=1987 /DNA_ORIENTATION=+
MLQSVKTFVAAKFSAAIPTADRPSALAAFADSSAAPPTPSASGAAPPSPPERMAAGSDSSEARHGRISPCAANPGASVRNGDKCSASPDPTGEREQPSPAAPASPPALAIAPWRAVRSQAEQRRWQHQEARRRLGSGATHAALRVCINEIRAEPLPPPPSRRARGRRGGAKQRSRAAPRSDHVSTPSVPQRAPAITGHQHAAEASAGLGRAALRALNVLQARDAAWQQRVRARRAAAAARLPPRNAHVSAWRIRAAALALQAGEARFRAVETSASAQDARLRDLERANLELTKTSASDRVELLRLRELIKTSASDQDQRLRGAVNALKKVTFSSSAQDARLRDLERANLELTKTSASDRVELLRLRELIKTSASDQDQRLRGAVNALKKVTFSSSAQDSSDARLSKKVDGIKVGIYEEMGKVEARLQHVKDRVGSDLGDLEHISANVAQDLRCLKDHVDSPPSNFLTRSPPFSRLVEARAKVHGQQAKCETLRIAGLYTTIAEKRGWRSHLHTLRTELANEVLALRRDLVALS